MQSAMQNDGSGIKLFLHIGQVKTGSTAIQTALANSLGQLDSHGYSFPADPSRLAAIQNGKTTSGNGAQLCRAIQSLSPSSVYELISKDIDSSPKSPNILYSSETLFFRLVDRSKFDLLVEAADKAGITHIEILLFVRNPVAHAVSWHGQLIKQGATSDYLDDFLLRYNIPIHANRVLRNCKNLANIRLRIHNYSFCKSHLLDIVWDFLRIPRPADCNSQEMLSAAPLNRSLTFAEAELCRQLTLHGCRPQSLANALTFNLPHIRPSSSAPKQASIDHLFKRNGDSLISLNSFLAKNEQLPVSRSDEQLARATDASNEFSFTSDQLSVIASEIARLHNMINKK